MTGPDLHAWVDESVHLDAPDGGIYVLAAAIGHPGVELDGMRETLRALVPSRQTRLHWHTESDASRRRIIDAIASMNLVQLVVVRVHVDPRRQERSRRKCMERLLFELSDRHVREAWLEGRDAALNRRDATLVEALRGSRSISSDLRVDFARPLDEPMLWVPDSVAGAVALAHKAGRRDYRDMLAASLSEIEP